MAAVMNGTAPMKACPLTALQSLNNSQWELGSAASGRVAPSRYCMKTIGGAPTR